MESFADAKLRGVLQAIAGHPEGISFNQLHKETKKLCARQTLVNKLEVLVEQGLIEKRKVGKQRVIYKDKQLAKRLAAFNAACEGFIEITKTIIDFLYLRKKAGKIDSRQTVSSMLEATQSYVYVLLWNVIELSLTFRGRSKELIALGAMKAFAAAITDYVRTVHNDPELRLAYLRLLAEKSTSYDALFQNTVDPEVKKEIDAMEDSELKSRLEKIFKT